MGSTCKGVLKCTRWFIAYPQSRFDSSGPIVHNGPLSACFEYQSHASNTKITQCFLGKDDRISQHFKKSYRIKQFEEITALQNIFVYKYLMLTITLKTEKRGNTNFAIVGGIKTILVFSDVVSHSAHVRYQSITWTNDNAHLWLLV